jgi:hypothetical protein
VCWCDWGGVLLAQGRRGGTGGLLRDAHGEARGQRDEAPVGWHGWLCGGGAPAWERKDDGGRLDAEEATGEATQSVQGSYARRSGAHRPKLRMSIGMLLGPADGRRQEKGRRGAAAAKLNGRRR